MTRGTSERWIADRARVSAEEDLLQRLRVPHPRVPTPLPLVDRSGRPTPRRSRGRAPAQHRPELPGTGQARAVFPGFSRPGRPGKPRFDVIDGQQRLTTLTILIAVLRDLAKSADLAAGLGQRIMEPGSELDELAPKPRLTLRQQDNAFFEQYVQEPRGTTALVTLNDASPDSEPQRAIRDNATALRRRLEKWTSERQRALAKLLNNDTYLVVVATPDLHSAYRIFSVMNARGMELSPPTSSSRRSSAHWPTSRPMHGAGRTRRPRSAATTSPSCSATFARSRAATEPCGVAARVPPSRYSTRTCDGATPQRSSTISWSRTRTRSSTP